MLSLRLLIYNDMTPIEKAKELVQHFKGRGMDGNEKYASKECAMIVVDEILHQFIVIKSSTNDTNSINERINFFNQAKKEIEKL